MKLHCHKCKKQLTESLVYIPLKVADFGGDIVWLNEKSIFNHWGFEDHYERKMKKGIFYISKKKPAFMNKYADEEPAQILPKLNPMLVVGKKSILSGVIPKFKYGYGCCNYSLGEPLLCACGTKVGRMFLDCYEDEYIKFYPKKVDRNYKR